MNRKLNEKKYFNWVTRVLFCIFIFLFLLKNSFNYLDPDLGWHLRVGKETLRDRSAPTVNHYDYPTDGDNWVDHEWLTNALIYRVYDTWGYIPLNVIMAAIVLAMLVLLVRFTRKYISGSDNNLFFVFAFQFLGVIAMAPHLGVRVQEITLLFLLWLMTVIYAYEKTKSIKPLLVLPILFCVWTNLHGGFLIGLFVLCIWLFINSFGFLAVKTGLRRLEWIELPALGFPRILSFAFFSGLSLVGTLFTPYGFRLYSFLSGYSDKYYLKHIEEWLPAWYPPIQYWQLLYTAFVVVALVLTAVMYGKAEVRRPEKQPSVASVKFWHLVLIAVFILMAFQSKRHFPLLFVVSFPVVARFFSFHLILPKKSIFDLPPKLSGLIKFLIIICFLLIIAAQAASVIPIREPFTAHCGHYPCKAVKFLKNNPQYGDLRIFNQYGWGGFLIWVWPEKQLFIDGRLPQHEFAGHTYLEEYYEFFDEEQVENKLRQYEIELALLARNKPMRLNWFEKHFIGLNEDKINSTPNHLTEYLDGSREWEFIYGDEVALVYAKNPNSQIPNSE